MVNKMIKEMIGLRVKELRLTKANMSQDDFARKMGIHRTYLSRIESGKYNVTIDTIILICESLDISLSDFFYPFKNIR